MAKKSISMSIYEGEKLNVQTNWNQYIDTLCFLYIALKS